MQYPEVRPGSSVCGAGLCHGGMDGLHDTRAPLASDVAEEGTLDAAMDADDVVMDVEVDECFTPPAYSKIDSEILLITDSDCQQGSPDILQCDVSRRQEGTVPASHAASTDVDFLNCDESYYLEHPPDGTTVVKFKNSEGEVVAYIDADGHVRHKGMVFTGWTDWDYWD